MSGILAAACCCGTTPCPPGLGVRLSMRFGFGRREILWQHRTLDYADCPTYGPYPDEEADFSCLWEQSAFYAGFNQYQQRKANAGASMTVQEIELPYDHTEDELTPSLMWYGNPGSGVTASGLNFTGTHSVDVCEGPWTIPTTYYSEDCVACAAPGKTGTDTTVTVRYGRRATYAAPPYPFYFYALLTAPGWKYEVSGGHLRIFDATDTVRADFDLSLYTFATLRTAIDAIPQIVASAIPAVPAAGWPATMLPETRKTAIPTSGSGFAFLFLEPVGSVTQAYQPTEAGPFWDLPDITAGPGNLGRWYFATYSGTEAQFCLSMQVWEPDDTYLLEGRSPLDGGWNPDNAYIKWNDYAPDGPCPPTAVVDLSCADKPPTLSGSEWGIRWSYYGVESRPATGAAQEYYTPVDSAFTYSSELDGGCEFDQPECAEQTVQDARCVRKLYQVEKIP